MSISKQTVWSAVISTSLALGLCACGRNGDTPGQTLDKGLNKTGDAIKDVGEAIKPK